MPNKWIDNEVYFGPDRRRRGENKRWGDRRRMNDAADPPPLGAVLRRLRVQITSLENPADRRRAQQLASLAIIEAEQHGLRDCADALKDAIVHIDQGRSAAADARIVEVMALL